MTSAARPTTLAPLLHLLAGAVLGSGLVWLAVNRASKLTNGAAVVFKQMAPGLLADAGLVGAAGGLLGGIVAGRRAADRTAPIPGTRFWMPALGAGGALTLGSFALRDAPSVVTSASGGPAGYVLIFLVVGWLVGVLLGAVGTPFAQTVSAVMAVALRKATTGRRPNAALVLGAVLGGTVWAVFWGLVVALIMLLALGVVILSVRAGGEGPALAVGGTCGCIFFGLRYVLLMGHESRS
jgi:hypothetical protein